MALPRNRKDIMIFNAGVAYIGDAMSFTAPKLARKLEEHRAGGMDRPVDLDMGGEKLEAEFTCASPMRDVILQYGGRISSAGLRFVETFVNDDTGAVDVVEHTVRGRHQEIDMGEAKVGEKTEFKVKLSLSYYKMDWNGATLLEIDPLGMIEIVNGVDMLADRRAAIGL